MITLKALAGDATFVKGMVETARSLALRLGDDSLPRVASSMQLASSALDDLAGSGAQRFIGPAVNFATDAQQRVSLLARTAAGGRIPSHAAFDDALRSVRTLDAAIAARL